MRPVAQDQDDAVAIGFSPGVATTSSPIETPPLILDSTEADRLAALRSYRVLDTPPDPHFDVITRTAARIFDMPIVLISLVDDERQWIKSAVGPIPAGSQTSRSVSFCSKAILEPDEMMIVGNTAEDPRFADNPLVTGFPNVGSYAGVVLRSVDGYAIGTLCVLDTRPRQLSASQIMTLQDLAYLTGSALELHRSKADLKRSVEHYRYAVEFNPHITWTADASGRLQEISPQFATMTGRPLWDGSVDIGWDKLIHPEDRPLVNKLWRHSIETGDVYDSEFRFRMADDTYRWFRVCATARRDSNGAPLCWYGNADDITERRRNQEKVAFLAYHDDLTGLPNRLQFRPLLDQLCYESDAGSQFALFCLNLDNFKAVNDTLGHEAGDMLLQRVSERLTLCLTGRDVVARFGGDEFLIIQADIRGPSQAAQLADDIRAALAIPMKLDAHSVASGVSIGIALFPRDGEQPEQLMRNADLALSRVKREEPGNHRFFQPQMDEVLRTSQALKIDLRHALARSEFHLVYQPLINVHTNKVDGFEALLRWHHPIYGLVPPSQFIMTAEETGLIVPIGQWVLEQACSQAKEWPDDVRIAVNLSPIQIRNHGLPRIVEAAIAASGIAPDRLELEITETVQLIEDNSNLAMLQELRRIGVRIVLDDFGSGYASLGYLQRFRFDKLKIDQSFITRMTREHQALAIVRAIVQLSRMFEISITAEGVETREQFELLRAEGCDQVQGYLFSRPVPGQETLPLVARIALGSQDGQTVRKTMWWQRKPFSSRRPHSETASTELLGLVAAMPTEDQQTLLHVARKLSEADVAILQEAARRPTARGEAQV